MTMTILGAVTRKALTAPVTSRAVVRSQARLGGKRFMGDGPDHVSHYGFIEIL